MRMPAIPLITVDPYFSVWTDNINDHTPYHWTGSKNTILGTVNVDGNVYRFLGDSEDDKLTVVSLDADTFSTAVVYEEQVSDLLQNLLLPCL